MGDRATASLESWRRFFADEDPSALAEVFRSVYGEDSAPWETERARYLRMLDRFAERFGETDRLVVARAPGRVNLVGMHIDHQGGAVNPIAIRETRVLAAPREDGRIVCESTDPRFPPRSFGWAEILPEQPVDWASWTQQIANERQAHRISVDWSDYVKGALIRLQEGERRPDGTYARRLCGMNLLVEGDVPVAAGLSSSSALVIAVGYATIALNGLRYEAEELVEFLGPSEWYSGLRGGTGDHAVILLARAGMLAHIELRPLRVEYAPFPSGCRVVVCHSGVEAAKSAGAQNTYNERVAGYAIGMMLLRRRYPAIMRRAKRFRDLYPERLGVSTAALYEMLKSLPIRATRADLVRLLPDDRKALAELYRSHVEEPEGYRLRGVCLYGVAECERSRKALEFLRAEDIIGFGELIDLSHEGDRVVDASGRPYEPDLSDAYFDRMIRFAESESIVEREHAVLYRQPGGYAASCPELDALVDTARRVPGVLGAGLIGAGLGGCISVLVQAEAVEALDATLRREYYARREIDPFIEVVTPVAGAGAFAAPQ